MREQGKWNRNYQRNMKTSHSVEDSSIKQNNVTYLTVRENMLTFLGFKDNMKSTDIEAEQLDCLWR